MAAVATVATAVVQVAAGTAEEEVTAETDLAAAAPVVAPMAVVAARMVAAEVALTKNSLKYVPARIFRAGFFVCS